MVVKWYLGDWTGPARSLRPNGRKCRFITPDRVGSPVWPVLEGAWRPRRELLRDNFRVDDLSTIPFPRSDASGGFEKFFEEAFYPAVDRSAAPPLVTEALLARVLAAALRHGLEFLPPTSDRNGVY